MPSNLVGAESIPARNPLSHERQNFPCSPKGYKPKPCPEVPHVLICPSASHTTRSLSSLKCALVGVTILSQQLFCPLGSRVCFPQSPYSSPGNPVPCYTVPWARALGNTHPCVRPCLQEWAPIHVGSKFLLGPTSPHEHFCPCREQDQKPRMSECQNPRGRELSPSYRVLCHEPPYHESNFSMVGT